MEPKDVAIVGDGTLDWKGKPAARQKTGKWTGSFPVLLLEVAETMAFFGISASLVTYMTTVMHEGVAQSAKDVNNWSGTLFISSVFGGFLADAYWGQYKTLSISIIGFTLGVVTLTISTSVSNLRPPQCPAQNQTCVHPTMGQSALFFLSLYIIAVSTGSLKANIISFGASQFDEDDEQERRQKQSFFHWFICSISTGSLISVTLLVYIENMVSWGLGFGILLVGIFIASALFFLQTTKYRYRVPEGSPLTKVAQVLVAAFRKRKLRVEDHELYEGTTNKYVTRTNTLRFLDKAAVKLNSDEPLDPWKLTTISQVEDVKRVVRFMPIWCSMLFLNVLASQALTYFVTQGMAMDNRLGNFKVPPGSMLIFCNLSQLTTITLYDRILVPYLQKWTKKEGGISLLQKIGAALPLSTLAIIIAALVERKRRSLADHHIQLSIFWLVPQYALLAMGEGFFAAGLYQFFHDEVPDGMHGLGTSIALANVGVGNFVSSLLISVVKSAAPSWLQNDINKGHVDYFYWLLAILASVVMVAAYIPSSLWYTYKQKPVTTEDHNA